MSLIENREMMTAGRAEDAARAIAAKARAEGRTMTPDERAEYERLYASFNAYATAKHRGKR